MANKEFTPTINATALRTTSKYVCWIDTMGTQNAMSESLAKSANFVLKLHSVILEAAKQHEDSVIVYPVMDGAYITCSNKKDITIVIRRVYNNLFQIFNDEQDFNKRFIVRGALAFGEIIDGQLLTNDVTTDLSPEYKKNLVLGMPIIQAFRSERSSPPYGMFIHESARKFDATHKMQGKTFRWWQKNKGKQIGEELIKYFDWCRYNYTLLEIDLPKIQTYIDSVKSYFIPYVPE